MTLSSRLDEARRKREQGLADQLEPDPLDLRFVEEGQHYDGHDLRTGYELTPERWKEIEHQERSVFRRAGLPRWNPRRAQPGGSLEDAPPLIDLTRVDRKPPLAPVAPSEPDQSILPPPLPEDDTIDLRTGDPVPDNVFQLPAWAPEQEVYEPPGEGDRRTTVEDCPNCGTQPTIDVVDIVGGVANLECPACGFRYQRPAIELRDTSP